MQQPTPVFFSKWTIPSLFSRGSGTALLGGGWLFCKINNLENRFLRFLAPVSNVGWLHASFKNNVTLPCKLKAGRKLWFKEKKKNKGYIYFIFKYILLWALYSSSPTISLQQSVSVYLQAASSHFSFSSSSPWAVWADAKCEQHTLSRLPGSTPHSTFSTLAFVCFNWAPPPPHSI